MVMEVCEWEHLIIHVEITLKEIRIIFNFCHIYETHLCVHSLSNESFKDKLFPCGFNLYLYSASVI